MSEHVKEIKRDGDYYKITGRVDGRDTSIHVPANSVDGMSRDKAQEAGARWLRRGADYERNAGG